MLTHPEQAVIIAVAKLVVLAALTRSEAGALVVSFNTGGIGAGAAGVGARAAPVADFVPVAEKAVIGANGACRVIAGIGVLLAGVALGAGAGIAGVGAGAA
jgi:hypothetical protein